MIRKQELKRDNKVKVTFVLPEDHPYGRASVVGDFNGWNPLANPFRRRGNRTFSTAVELNEGERHAFRYLADGGRWFDDPDCDTRTPNGAGSYDCVVVT